MKTEKKSSLGGEGVTKKLLDRSFLSFCPSVCFLFEGREETKTGGKDYEGRRLLSETLKIKVPIVFVLLCYRKQQTRTPASNENFCSGWLKQ